LKPDSQITIIKLTVALQSEEYLVDVQYLTA
jgi:hypothetical protein